MRRRHGGRRTGQPECEPGLSGRAEIAVQTYRHTEDRLTAGLRRNRNLERHNLTLHRTQFNLLRRQRHAPSLRHDIDLQTAAHGRFAEIVERDWHLFFCIQSHLIRLNVEP